MKITREINGQAVEFELTGGELLDAYIEQEFKGDRLDMQEYISEYDEADFEGEYGRKPSDMESELDELAYLLRKNIDKYGVCWSDARDEALKDWYENQV